jgi:TolC family type I secretion outer membrane protein
MCCTENDMRNTFDGEMKQTQVASLTNVWRQKEWPSPMVFVAIFCLCCLPLNGWAQTEIKTLDNTKLSEGGELVLRLGEPQIEYLQPFLKDAQRAWGQPQLEGFRKDIISAVSQHPDVLSAKAGYSVAGYAIREVEAARMPQISAQIDNGRKIQDPSALLATPARDYKTAALTLNVRQLLYDFGATTSAIDGGNARSRAAWSKLQMVQGDTAMKAIQVYHELIRAERQVELARKNIEARESILDLVKQRNDLGGGTLSDVVRAQSRVAEAGATLTTAIQRLGIIRSNYKEVFNQEPTGIRAQSPVFEVLLDGNLSSDFATAGAESWKVKVAIASKEAAAYDLKAIRAKALPSIGLELSSSRRDLVAPGIPGTDNSWMIVARQSLYAGGGDIARINQAQQKLNQSEEDLESARRESARVLEQVILEDASQQQVVRNRLQAATLAADSLRMIREQYAYRRGTLLDLLTAQETLNFAGRDLIDAQIDRAMGTYKILNAAALLNRFMAITP